VLHAVSAPWPTTRAVGPDGTVTTITTLRPAVDYGVVGALQDLRKDVFTVRNLFPGRNAIRLDEPEQAGPCLPRVLPHTYAETPTPAELPHFSPGRWILGSRRAGF
jgi:hypothetical protein